MRQGKGRPGKGVEFDPRGLPGHNMRRYPRAILRPAVIVPNRRGGALHHLPLPRGLRRQGTVLRLNLHPASRTESEIRGPGDATQGKPRVSANNAGLRFLR